MVRKPPARTRNDQACQDETQDQTQEDGRAQAQPSAARTPSEQLRMDKAIRTLIAFLEKHLGQGSTRPEDRSPDSSPDKEDSN